MSLDPGFAAVVFDLGGVVLDSPMHVIADYERERGFESGSINRAVAGAGHDGAWARHERGELDRRSFLGMFAVELAAHGMDVDTARLMERVEASFRVRPEMAEAVERIRSHGIKAAAITNNWIPFEPDGIPRLFDVFLESVIEGVRKPEAEIYLRCLERLGEPPHRVVMLDDLGPNLKPARSLGMETIKVVSVPQALTELGGLLRLDLA